MRISGIYQIQSKIHPERIYIGSAVDIADRWGEHLRSLKDGVHGNSKLQNHFNKYGEQDLIFSTLCTCEKEQLLQFEQYFLDFYQPWNFNICRVAGSMLGFKHSEETKRIISEIQIGKPSGREGKQWSEESKRNFSESLKGKYISEKTKIRISKALRIPVLQYDLQNNFIRRWDGAVTASKELSIDQNHIRSCRNGNRKTAGGFVWKHEFDKNVA